MRAYSTALIVAAFWLAAAGAAGEDLLLTAQPGEVRLGPFAFTRNVEAVAVDLRAAAFLKFRREGEKVLIEARVITDLADVQKKIGALVGHFPLPTDNCAHFSFDNPVARIHRTDLSVQGSEAILRLEGDAELWTCQKAVPCSKFENWRLVFYDCNPPIELRNVQQPFAAVLPFRLVVTEAQALRFEPGSPTVNLGGQLGGVTEAILEIAGVNITDIVRAELGRVVNVGLPGAILPEPLLRLDPVLTEAEFLSNDGTLAAEIRLRLAVDHPDSASVAALSPAGGR